MQKKLNPREVRNKLIRLSEALFGEPAEVDEGEAEELLAAAGIDASELDARMYSRLNTTAQRYWTKQQSVPPLLKQALEELRPASAPARNEKELAIQAKSLIERLVETAKLVPALAKYQTPRFATLYRNKGQITESDKDLIDKAKSEIEDKLRKMGEEGNEP
ncbi:MAG TPA: hypothetical protein VNW97_05945 [Candidatus Saccharimonadales bacterium]|jgi:hypothetical protein|nr:hypothetical protein [Candidatus Saccharimonadales bacterium]